MFELKRKARDLFRDERGAVVVWVAIFMTGFLALSAIGVDAAQLFLIKGQLQVAAEAAAHAGAAALWPTGAATAQTASAIAAAQNYAAKNMPDPPNGIVVKPADVQVGHWDPAAKTFTPAPTTQLNAVQVTAYRATSHANGVPAWFANFVGVSSTDVVATAIAAHSNAFQEWDWVIAQDVTLSFVAELQAPSKIAQTADQNMLNCANSNGSGNAKAGLVVFTGFAAQVPSAAALQPLSSGASALNNFMNNTLNQCQSAGMPASVTCLSGTSQAAGITTAYSLLHAVPAGNTVGKTVIMVTDGQPNCGNRVGCTIASEQTNALNAATAAGRGGVDLFLVYSHAPARQPVSPVNKPPTPSPPMPSLLSSPSPSPHEMGVDPILGKVAIRRSEDD